MRRCSQITGRRRQAATYSTVTRMAAFAVGVPPASRVSARTGIAWSGKGAEDMCDAWVLQEMGLALLGRARYEWPRENLAALEKISLPDISEG